MIAKNPIIYLAKKLWHFGSKKTIIKYVLLLVMSYSIDFLTPLVIGKVLNIIQTQGIYANNLWLLTKWLSVFLLITIASWAFYGPARVLENKNAFIAKVRYKKYLLNGVMGFSAEWHSRHHSGETIDKINKGTDGLFRFGEETFLIVETILSFTASFIAISYFNLHASYIIILMMILISILIAKFDKIIVKQYKELNKNENSISAKIVDIITNITTVIILRVQKLVSRALTRTITQPYDLFIKNSKINELKWFLVSLCTASMTFLVLFSYIFFAEGGILVGTVYILYGYIERINQLFFRIAYKYGDVVRQRTAVLNAEEIEVEFAKQKKSPSLRFPSKWTSLEIRNLSFSYPSAKNPQVHLDNINLTIKRKEKIAFIGESGSGKTTLLRLMRNLYHPQKLSLSIDEQKLEFGFDQIRSEIALIPQDPEIFSTTIKENITLGIRHTKEYIEKYMKLARFSSVAKRLPHGINSYIYEKGVNLSGGQKQRLALARGLLAVENKQIILLDEPTSSVDARNERAIYQGIFREFKRKTIISSIHRLHLLPYFDTIVLFKQGKIAAKGTFNEMRKNPEFMKLWRRYKN